MRDESGWTRPPSTIVRRSRRPVRDGRLRRATLVLAVASVGIVASALVAREAAAAERRAADRRLTAVVDSAAAAFRDAVTEAETLARARARDRAIVEALARGDERALAAEARADLRLAFVRGGRVIGGGGVPTAAIHRRADVVDGRRTLGSVVVTVVFDDALVRRLRRATRLHRHEQLVVVDRGRVVAGGQRGRLDVPPLGTATVEHAGRGFRAAGAPLVRNRPALRLAVLMPLAVVEQAAEDRQRRVLVAALATAVALALVAAATAIWRRQRRFAARTRAYEHERRNVRDALSLVGDALASTHDTEALLPVIVNTAVEAAGATGATLLREDQEVIRAGRPSASKSPLVLPLGTDDDGRALRLLLYAPGAGPQPEARELAEWFVSQAAIALENARLHGIVKRQAMTDGLTGLFNRRRFVEALEAELSRAERFDTELAVVIADLDDFKRINDTFGHEVGNDVLRRFAELITETLRDVDAAARLGGEEFAMLLPQTGLEGGTALAERLRAELAATSLSAPDGTAMRVTGSFGVAAYPPTGSVDALLRAADHALYRAKAAGKNRVDAA